LDSEEGAMMAETHFKLHLMNCKKVWTEALKKRQEVTYKLGQIKIEYPKYF